MANIVDVNTINPFLTSSVSVIQTTSGITPKIGSPSIKDTSFTEESVLIILGVTGQLEGQVIFEIKEKNAKLLASKMMMGYEVAELDNMALSAISELGNMIMGNSATVFSQQNTIIDITPPMMARGNMIISRQYAVNICIPLFNDDNDILMNINIAIKKDTQ